MKERKGKVKNNKDYDNKYNINDKYDLAFNHGTTEQTGVVRPAAVNKEELESYNEIFPFKTEDIVPKYKEKEK